MLMEKEGDDVNKGEWTFEGNSRVGMMTTTSANGGSGSAVSLVYKLGAEFVLHSLRTSPLMRKYRLDVDDNKSSWGGGDDGVRRIRLISLAHNPETQAASHLSSNGGPKDLKGAWDRMRQRLTSAFVGYKVAVRDG